LADRIENETDSDITSVKIENGIEDVGADENDFIVRRYTGNHKLTTSYYLRPNEVGDR